VQFLIIETDDKNKNRKANQKKISLLYIRGRSIAPRGRGGTVKVKKCHGADETDKNHQDHIKIFKQAPVYSKHNPIPSVKFDNLISNYSQDQGYHWTI
jgi:hypothetical protein